MNLICLKSVFLDELDVDIQKLFVAPVFIKLELKVSEYLVLNPLPQVFVDDFALPSFLLVHPTDLTGDISGPFLFNLRFIILEMQILQLKLLLVGL